MMGFSVWNTSIDHKRDEIARQKSRNVDKSSDYDPELWACDADGNPTGRLNVRAIDLLKWTASLSPRPEHLASLFEEHESTGMPRAFVLFTLPEATPPATSAVPLMGIDELDKELKTALKDVNWNAITQYPTMLSRSNAPAFAIDLPSFKKAGIPDMTLAPHPEDFYTRKHANDVITRLKVWRACARLRAC